MTVTGRRFRLRGARHVVAGSPGLVLSWLVLVMVAAWAVVPGWFTSQNPIRGVIADRLAPPSLAHPFGTDYLGRDLFARVVHGAAMSLEATALAVLVGVVVGGAIGTIAGYLGGWIEAAIMRIMDVMLAIPGLLLALALVSALGFGVVQVAIAVGVASVAAFARVIRSEVVVIRNAAFVEIARGSGVGRWRMLVSHVVPNSAGSLLALAALDIGNVLLTVSALSFLGFGASPPTPEWGSLVASGENYLYAAWWLATLPGVVVGLTVLAANRVARALEPHARRAW